MYARQNAKQKSGYLWALGLGLALLVTMSVIMERRGVNFTAATSSVDLEPWHTVVQVGEARVQVTLNVKNAYRTVFDGREISAEEARHGITNYLNGVVTKVVRACLQDKRVCASEDVRLLLLAEHFSATPGPEWITSLRVTSFRIDSAVF